MIDNQTQSKSLLSLNDAYHYPFLKSWTHLISVCTVSKVRNHGQGTKTSDATGRDLFPLHIKREAEAIMSPTQMDLPLFQGIQDTRADTVLIPMFRPLLYCDLEMFYPQQFKCRILKRIARQKILNISVTACVTMDGQSVGHPEQLSLKEFGCPLIESD